MFPASSSPKADMFNVVSASSALSHPAPFFLIPQIRPLQ